MVIKINRANKWINKILFFTCTELKLNKNGPSSEMPKQSQNNLVSLSKNLIQAKYHFIVAYEQILFLL